MNFNAFTLWFDIIAGISLIAYGIYYTWLDKRIRIIMVYPDKKITISKHNLENGERFNKDKKTYVFDEKAVFIRSARLPYCFYYFNNPKPIIIKPEQQKDGYVYTGQEINKLLETDFTLKLLTPKVNVKKIALGLFILIAVGIIVLVILHFMGIINIGELIGGTLGTTPPPVK